MATITTKDGTTIYYQDRYVSNNLTPERVQSRHRASVFDTEVRKIQNFFPIAEPSYLFFYSLREV
jgi:hypothetical protein